MTLDPIISDYMSAIPHRLSFIGKRPINFFKSDVAVNILPKIIEGGPIKFGKLPFKNIVRVSGKLGNYDINIVDGLNCKVDEGLSTLESKLTINIDLEKYQGFNKYQRAFLKSMHGTTNSILMRYIEGISEVLENQ